MSTETLWQRPAKQETTPAMVSRVVATLLAIPCVLIYGSSLTAKILTTAGLILLPVVMLALADHSATTDQRVTVEAALEHVNAALEVFDEDQTPFYNEKAMRLRQRILDRLASDD